MELSYYYDLPSLSLKASCYHAMVEGKAHTVGDIGWPLFAGLTTPLVKDAMIVSDLPGMPDMCRQGG